MSRFAENLMVVILGIVCALIGWYFGVKVGRAEMKRCPCPATEPAIKPAGCEGIFLEGYGDEVHFAKATVKP